MAVAFTSVVVHEYAVACVCMHERAYVSVRACVRVYVRACVCVCVCVCVLSVFAFVYVCASA